MLVISWSYRLLMAAAILCILTETVRPQQSSTAPSAANLSSQVPSQSENTTLQQITVTGYITPRIGEGPMPVTTLDQDFFSKQGNQTLNDVLNRLPNAFSQQNQITFVGQSTSPASSALGLRGLTANSTLVLVDGYRFPFYPFPINSTETFVDLNSIPLAAVDRIEILKDNGSATYGADAVAGVINLVTKDSYNGVDIYNYYGISQRGDFEVYHGSLTAGLSDKLLNGNFNIVTTFDYYDQSPIHSLDRWYSYGDRSKLSPNYPDQPVAIFPAQGSFTGVTSGNTYQVKRGTTGSAITANDFIINGETFNTYIPLNEELAARENRYGGTVNLNWSPIEWLRLYDKFIIQRVEENSETPNQGFSSFDNIIIPASNPYNPFGEDLVPQGQSLRELGPWQTDVISRTFRNLGGLTLQFPNDSYVDASFLYGESDATWTVSNSTKRDALQAALSGTLPQLPGQYFNPFTDQDVAGHPNAKFYPYIRTQQVQDSRTGLLQWTLKGGGTVYELPSGPMSIAGGLEYRSEELINSNDVNSRNNNVTSPNFAGALLSARRYVRSVYGQLDVPLFGGRWSWPGARALDFTFSYRYDDYSTFGDAGKPKFSLRYKPFDDLTFRLSYSEGFVAPTLGELFGTPIQSQSTVTDPKTGSLANVVVVNGGNPNLKPETAYDYYAEMVWTPGSKDENSWWHWAKGFTGYIDWYQINLRNFIGALDAQTVVSAEDALPGAVIRGPDGRIVRVNANYQNLGADLTEGIEFGASYVSKEYNWGKLDLECNAAYIYNFAANRITRLGPNRAGYLVLQYADSFGLPDFKLVSTLFYSKHVFGSDNFRTGFTINYVDSEQDSLSTLGGSQPVAASGLFPVGTSYVHQVGSWTTVDWQISYTFGAPEEVTPEMPYPGYTKDGKI
ncbi:MAG: TonB-dependent receptor, partial [Verrucomicrobia bacterium]|nr:TonB-dependent receptor [Verrucomicrobiota bacterium]